MIKLKELIQRIAIQRKEEHPFPDNLEGYLDDFVPNILLQSETLEKAFGVSRYEMEELYQEGFDYYHSDKYTDSATIFRWLVILNPFIAKYWMGLASNQQLLDQWKKALHSYAIVALLDAENPLPHYHAYECYTSLGNSEEARKALDCAYQLAAHHPEHIELRQEIEKLQECREATCQ